MMKKHLLLGLTLFLCLAVQPVMAQLQDERHNFSIGVNGGVNISSVSFMPRIREGKQIGPSFGLTARYISEKYFSMICGIQMELNYSQRGWKEVYEDETGDTYHRAMNYLELPILAHLAFGKDEGNGLRFIVNLGPQFGGGVEIRTGIGHFLIEARYYYGLSDFYNNSKKDYFERSGHSYIAGRVTYLFDLKK